MSRKQHAPFCPLEVIWIGYQLPLVPGDEVPVILLGRWADGEYMTMSCDSDTPEDATLFLQMRAETKAKFLCREYLTFNVDRRSSDYKVPYRSDWRDREKKTPF